MTHVDCCLVFHALPFHGKLQPMVSWCVFSILEIEERTRCLTKQPLRPQECQDVDQRAFCGCPWAHERRVKPNTRASAQYEGKDTKRRRAENKKKNAMRFKKIMTVRGVLDGGGTARELIVAQIEELRNLNLRGCGHRQYQVAALLSHEKSARNFSA